MDPKTIAELQQFGLIALPSFLAGTLTEPLKIMIGQAYTKRRVRNICYRQILTLRNALRACSNALVDPSKVTSFGTNAEFATTLLTSINLGPLKYAVEKEPGILYQLDVYPIVSKLIYNLDDIPSDMPLDEMKKRCDLVMYAIDSAADQKQISARKLTRIAIEEKWAHRWQWGAPAPVQAFDNAYRNDSSFAGTRPILAKRVHGFRRIMAYFRHFSEESKRGR